MASKKSNGGISIIRKKKVSISQNQKVIKEVRGTGLLLGLQIKVNQAKFIEKLMKEKLLTVRAAENVVRILPPLNVTKKEIDQAVTIISKVCNCKNIRSKTKFNPWH